MVSLRRLNRQTKGSVDRALEHETALADVYAGQLARAATHAATQFRQRARVSLSAAVNPQTPDWVPPDPDELTTDPLDAQAQAKARRIHLQALVAAAPQAVKDLAEELGISFDGDAPAVAALLDKVAARTVSLTQETRDVMRKVIGQAYADGWSVTQTADALQTQIADLGRTTAVMQARTDLVGLGNGASIASAMALGDAAPPMKVWLTAGDELVRETHADAEGQEVPLDQPFQVGDDELMYPGDPDGSDAEVCNCRCTVVYSDGTDADALEASAARSGSSVRPAEALPSPSMGTDTASPEALAAAVTVTVDDEADDAGASAETATPIRWRGILCVEGEDSQDGPGLVRTLAPGGGTWRTPPLPLGVMFETPHAFEVPAPICGAIDTIYRSPDDEMEIWGEGWINQDEIGCRAAELISNLSLRGISIDPYVAEMDVQEPADVPDVDGSEVLAEDGAVAVQPTRLTFKRYVIGGATICPFQALESAQIAIVAGAGRPEEEPHVTTLSQIALVDPAVAEEEETVEPETLTAAATMAAPPREWFETQEPPGAMPLTVTDDGRVFGHLALWDSCHVGIEGQCVRPPRSASQYAYFHVGELETADGSRVAVGKLMIAKAGRAGKHASLDASRLEAAKHYDDNTAVGAYIRVVDGRYGPWAAGCVRPGLGDDEVAQLRANPPSGDWRRANGPLELIAALSVPVPGFPVPRAQAALVAAGDLLEVGALVASSGRVVASEFVCRALERAGVLPRSEQRLARPQAVA